MPINIPKPLFFDWLKSKGLSERTLTEYNRYFDKFELCNPTQEDLISFLNRNDNNVARAFIKNLIYYVHISEFNNKDAFAKLLVPKKTGRKRKRLPDILTESDIYLIHDKLKGERNQIALLVAFYGGLRESEYVGQYAIKPHSFKWQDWLKYPHESGTLKIIGKGDKQRNVFIPSKVMSRIYQWIRNDVSKRQTKDQPLFNIGDRRWRTILAKASREAIGREIYPHLLRHSCSLWLKIARSWNPLERQRYLGHESLNTTTIYDRVDDEDLRNKFTS